MSKFLGHTFGAEIRQARLKSGLSQAEVAMLSGISQANISLLEGGRSDPRASTLAAVAAVVGLHLELVPKGGRARPPTTSRSVLDDVLVPDPTDDEE